MFPLPSLDLARIVDRVREMLGCHPERERGTWGIGRD